MAAEMYTTTSGSQEMKDVAKHPVKSQAEIRAPVEGKDKLWIKFVSFFWDTARKGPEEQALLNRLDFFLLSYIVLSFLIKTLDQTNITNAYVSGMKEDLALNGNELNYFTTAYNMGYLVGSMPIQLLMGYVRPSVVLPACEVVWGALVMALAGANSAKYIYIFRAIIGFLEAAAYPAFARCIGSWYKPDELGKRMILFGISASLASMISGYIQAGVYTSMNGVHGLAGWRWLFIIDGVISIPIACMGFVFFPDFPTTTRAMWLNEQQRALAIRRMDEIGRAPPRRMTVKRFVMVWFQWRTHAYLWTNLMSGLQQGQMAYMNLWLKSLKYSVQKINILPTIGYAIAIVCAYIYAIISDHTGWRWQLMVTGFLFKLLGNILLAVWDIPFGLKFFAYLCPNFGEQNLFLTWAAENFQDDSEIRGILPAAGNMLMFGFNAWVPVLIFPTAKAPVFLVGYSCSAGFCVVGILGILLMRYLFIRRAKQLGYVKNEYGLLIPPELGTEYVPRDEESGGETVSLEKETVAVYATDK
ncbi:major facilitator superfamily domain-containing protein [Lipomyces orientalis]|uniref:Major facilitator superfamily domain-containing protein n=1 Tax=Lipomyces orientalis TaxID=1233043 RepID=A0ACC3TJC6_9ASCO